MRKLKNILDTISKEDPAELQRIHDDIIARNMAGHPDEKMEDVDLEVDDQVHNLPFRSLREYLQTGKVTESDPRHLNRIPSTLGKSIKLPEDESDMEDSEDMEDDEYYWDKNYNYEYMNPQSKLDRVLGKLKK